MTDALLDIRKLSVAFGRSRVIRDLDLSIRKGRILCLVGESGSGKSMTAFSIMDLLPSSGRIVSGSIRFNGMDVLSTSGAFTRGKDIAMIFQEPMTSLNPVLPVGRQIAEPMEIHLGLSPKDALARTVHLMADVGIPDPEKRLGDFPHQFSGGMRQRVMIAMALSCSPRLLLADEPTTALDITIQRQILDLITSLANRHDMGVLLITHDLGVVAEAADDVAVMYAGEIVEYAPAETFFKGPRHPYSRALMDCAPLLGNHYARRLPFIPGSVPIPTEMPEGCAFKPRCQFACNGCDTHPLLLNAASGHAVRCHNPLL